MYLTKPFPTSFSRVILNPWVFQDPRLCAALQWPGSIGLKTSKNGCPVAIKTKLSLKPKPLPRAQRRVNAWNSGRLQTGSFNLKQLWLPIIRPYWYLSYYASGVPFARWDNEQVACWLHDIGLNHYVSNCKSWVKNGETLLNASNKNMEHDLGIKNPLHRFDSFVSITKVRKPLAFTIFKRRLNNYALTWITEKSCSWPYKQWTSAVAMLSSMNHQEDWITIGLCDGWTILVYHSIR